MPNPLNPSTLPTRYEIRQLDSSHIPWAAIMFIHSNFFHSPICSVLYPAGVTARVHAASSVGTYLVTHQIIWGHSYGVFDTKYVFQRAESASVGGALYWDASERKGTGCWLDGLPARQLALSYDSIHPLDMAKLVPLIETVPYFATMYYVLEELDSREKAAWEAKGIGEVLFRSATFTRHDYEGKLLMAGLARWLMREAELKGFRTIQIECAHDTVTHVWSHPDKARRPYWGTIVSQIKPKPEIENEYEREMDGEMVVVKEVSKPSG
ncbi:hypothetical protein CC78DRAFT_466186 [Lojkania enalia]|uniref:Uncharacterized protein n=1 Tax=Lojkania enalia TaxID=147567 RepID=A0A9P4N2B9_9PLEO|nr:hypothetical protein CC78DRAFT_466186 [Didymosphaeria enalia]